MRLKDIIKDLNYINKKELENEKELESNKEDILDKEIEDIIYDSRKAREGVIFVALKGYALDAHKYIEDVYNKGVRVFLVNDYFNEEEKYPYGAFFKVENTRKGLAEISWSFFNNPQNEMLMIGITGTKGKTTVSHYIRDILEKAGKKTGIIGTMGCFYNGKEVPTNNTTPESYEIAKVLRDMLNNGVNHLVMEVSSGGIMNNRVHGLNFDYGIFLNLSHDHVGGVEHPTFEHYKECKGKLFENSKISIINFDDKEKDFFLSKAKNEIITYSIKDKNQNVVALNIEEGKSFRDLGESFTLKYKDVERKMKLNVPGKYSVYNALAAASVALSMGISMEIIEEAMKTFKVKGRFDIQEIPDDFHVVIDYAHNGESIGSVLNTINSYNPKEVILLTGSVGGRTKERRHEITEASLGKINKVVLTEDNPDFEDPNIIIDEMASTYEGTNIEVFKEPNREKAIALALSLGSKDSVVLLAGKGHEEYNIVNGKKVPYSDYKSVENYYNNKN